MLSPVGVISSIVLAKPDCPLCKMGMRPVQAMPVLFSHDLDEVGTSVTMRTEHKEDAQAALRPGGCATPPLLIECIRCHGGLSHISRGSSDAAVYADLAPLADGHL